MRSITDAVRTIINKDEVAREAARREILNASAYAREIAPQVAEHTWKEVQESSVTVSINRVVQESRWPPIKPDLLFDKVSVETGLVDVTFERTQEFRKLLNSVLPELRHQFSQDLFIETSGQHQITMIMSHNMWTSFQQRVDQPPIGIFEHQVAISIAFDQCYLEVPNFIYAVLGIFALENINITEIFSTLTEIVVVVHTDYLDTALAGVKKYMK